MTTTEEEVIIKSPEDVKSDAVLSVIVIAVFTALFIGYFIYSRYVGVHNTIYTRIREFYGSSLSQLSLGLVIVFLVSDVVNAFNKSVMFPVIRSSFPNEDVWLKGVTLPRGQVMYPGLFLQSIVSFVLSIGVMFMIGEFVHATNNWYGKYHNVLGNPVKKTTDSNLYLNIGYIFVIVVFVGLIGWNVSEILNPKEEEVHVTTRMKNISTI